MMGTERVYRTVETGPDRAPGRPVPARDVGDLHLQGMVPFDPIGHPVEAAPRDQGRAVQEQGADLDPPDPAFDRHAERRPTLLVPDRHRAEHLLARKAVLAPGDQSILEDGQREDLAVEAGAQGLPGPVPPAGDPIDALSTSHREGPGRD